MVRSKLFCTAILTLAVAGPVSAQRLELISIPQAANPPVSRSTDTSEDALLRSVAEWISHVFGLAEIQSLPAVRRFPAGAYAHLSDTGPASGRLTDTAVINYQRSAREVVARYDDATRMIYLPDGWDGSTPAQMSALVHAMTHHFQNVGGRKYYDCPEERKALPYEAQGRWLGLYGRGLNEDFGIDQAALMLITQCMP